MSSLIKKNLLHKAQAGECLIAPDKELLSSRRRSRRNRMAGIEDAARSMIEQARVEAQALIMAASEEAQSIRNTAYNEGYEAGLHQLDEDRRLLAEWSKQTEIEVEQQVEEFWRSIEPQLLSLSVEIARKIIGHEIDQNDEFVMDTVRSGLRQLRDRQDLKIRVSPDDYELLRSHKDDLTGSCDGIRSIEIIDDRRVGKGGCLIESSNGNLDARIETQTAEVERALMEAARHGSTETAADA